jgi:hypothetical protein
VPKRFKDLLAISPAAQKKYTKLNKQLKIIDSILCITAVITIVLAVLDVNNSNYYRIIQW